MRLASDIREITRLGTLEEVLEWTARRHGPPAHDWKSKKFAREAAARFLEHGAAREDLRPALRLAEETGLFNPLEEGGGADGLRGVVERYLAATAYLFPVFEDFADMVSQECRKAGVERLVFFLRDSLFFVPSFLRRKWDAEGMGKCYLNKRILEDFRSGSLPQRALDACVQPPLDPSKRYCFLDVGAYGTLVDYLLERRKIPKGSLVISLVSRNPHLADWLNGGRSPARGLEKINLLDSVEALVKPMDFFSMDGQGRIVRADNDFLSSLLAHALLWALYRGPEPGTDGRGPRWYLREPVPAWPHWKAFVDSWKHGTLAPREGA
jgi:hypothetical protein